MCCEYLGENSLDEFRNPPVGVPKTYVNAYRKSKRVKKRKRKGRKLKTSNFKLTEDGMVYREADDGGLFDCDGKNAFLHKTVSDVRVSSRSQRFSKPPEVCTDFYHQFPLLFSGFPEFDLDKHIVVDGCFDTNKHTVQAQMDTRNCDGVVLPTMEHYKIFKTAIRDAIRKIKINNLGDVSITDIQDFDFDLTTKPGYRFENYLLKKEKKDCVKEAVFLAEERYSNILNVSKDGKIIKRKDILPGIYTLGARNKREADAEQGDCAVSRAVHMPEFHVELHGGIFSDLLTHNFKEKNEGPIFIGNSFLKGERLGKLIENNYCAIEGDWKKFDASLNNVLITLALCICRLYFPDGLFYDNSFLAILDSLIIKDYHTVGGRVYRILHGLPSGSKWTSIIGSVLNLIILNYSFSSIKYYDRAFAIGGDDFVVFIKKEGVDLSELEIDVTELSTQIGMTLKFFKKKLYSSSDCVEDYPVFYKYTYFQGRPIIPAESILERVFSPWNKKYKTNGEVLEFLDNLLPSLGYPTSSCFLFYLFYKYVYNRATGKGYKIENLLKRHFYIFHRMVEIGVPLKELKKSETRFMHKNRSVYSAYTMNKEFLRKIFFLNESKTAVKRGEN